MLKMYYDCFKRFGVIKMETNEARKKLIEDSMADIAEFEGGDEE